MGKAPIAARESGKGPYALLEEFVPWERFVESVAEAEDLAVPEAFDFLERLKDHHKRLRRFSWGLSASPPPLLRNPCSQQPRTGARSRANTPPLCGL